MALFSRPSPAKALSIVLDQEREFLLSGQLEALAKIAPEKERLFQLLPKMAIDADTLKVMAQKADYNQVLLSAASKGIRTVSRRLEVLRNQKSQLRTYDAGGHSKNLARPTTQFEKRA